MFWWKLEGKVMSCVSAMLRAVDVEWTLVCAQKMVDLLGRHGCEGFSVEG
jgi:hypothetical protein